MSLDVLSELLGWALLINLGLYLMTVVAAMHMRPWICRMHQKMFGISPDALPTVLYCYIGAYKLLIIVFNFVPWLAVQIVR